VDGGGGTCSNKPGSPLAVPLEPPQVPLPPVILPESGPLSGSSASTAQQQCVGQPAPLLLMTRESQQQSSLVMTNTEVEFRKPLLPPPAAAAALRQQQGAAMSAAFREQVGQYLPKFTNRRGRQNRSRAKNLVVGRQLLQQPRQLLMMQQQQPQLQQHVHIPGGLQQLFPQHQITILETTIAAPVTIFTNTTTTGGGEPVLPQQHRQLDEQQQPQELQQQQPPFPISLGSLASSVALSPPQISIPSPALSPVRRDTPSPTPSLSSLMDLSFSDSVISSAATVAALGLSTPPKNGAGRNLTFLTDIFVEDSNSLLHTPPRPSTPTRPPSRFLADPAADLSLSSWALSFDSPLKGGNVSAGPLLHTEDSQASIISTSSEVVFNYCISVGIL
jgi:hypothetical protein